MIRYFDLIQHQVLERVSVPGVELVSFDLDVPFVPSAPVEGESNKKVTEKKGAEKKDASQPTPAKQEKKDDKKKTAGMIYLILLVEPAPKATESIDPSKLDIRVGRVLSVERHPEADSLYVESIDLGEDAPRTVVSGLVKFMKEEDLLNQYVVLLCNLKPAKMRGIESCAMVLCATSADGTKVEFLQPPPNSSVGDVISFEGFNGKPEALLKPKQKIWEAIQPNLFTNSKKEACFILPDSNKEVVMKTKNGVVTVKSNINAPIK